ncbi:hypothetical protein DM02DRAFT_702556 [Periconia macrospinosa]|uniref:Uncharacterized protein n=1 Tax=Periconia macrospinosa TaxID=97972 RepID=A0A2V1D1L7_9PLEO|nr:hypothetical protein DM02DRAFT_702556 [Periconia macrospinosa]
MMEISITTLGDSHSDTLTSMINLAFTWKSLGCDAEAIELMKECVRLRLHVLGTTYLNYISSLGSLYSWETEKADISSLTLHS